MRTRLAVVAGLVAVVAALAGCSSGSAPPTATTPTGTTSTAATGPTTATTPATTAATTSASTSATTVPAAGLVPLWPFTTSAQVSAWQAAYRASGREPWHLDPGRTALDFTRLHLGYAEVDRVSSLAVQGGDAHVGVGWSDPESAKHTVAVLHLIRSGSGADAPWVVVGSDDTDLTLTVPRYGSTVSSPLAVGGVITGVDESLRVVVLGPTSATPLGVMAGLPAGGTRTPWAATVRFAARSGSVLTVAVSTGGHLRSVERFAVTAVRVR